MERGRLLSLLPESVCDTMPCVAFVSPLMFDQLPSNPSAPHNLRHIPSLPPDTVSTESPVFKKKEGLRTSASLTQPSRKPSLLQG